MTCSAGRGNTVFRIKISNEKELGFTLTGTYTQEESPYTIYVYDAG
ncbi:MAG: DUF6044 family protein [Eisenbergiella massiliensis]